MRPPQQLREDILAIWRAGVDGVQVDRLVRQAVSFDPKAGVVRIEGVDYPLSEIDRIVLLGAGKASGAMAETLLSIFSMIPHENEILGRINVPEGAVPEIPTDWKNRVHIVAVRPMGSNEPTEQAVAGTREMVRLLKSLTPRDLCLVLLSGGGSALMPAPVEEISLEDKLELTRFLSGAGASISELNTVRKQLSLLKGGGMKSLAQGKRLIALILSDVLGDPLEIIASGPTIDNDTDAGDALGILRTFIERKQVEPAERLDALGRIIRYLAKKAAIQKRIGGDANVMEPDETGTIYDLQGGFVRNLIIGNNALAVDAAGLEAVRRGYSHAMHVARAGEGAAEQVGDELLRLALDMQHTGPDCLIHGGEPIVNLVSESIRGKGGRNQQLVLAALTTMLERYADEDTIEIAILSGGTDGEDGPTDAAGAWFDPMMWKEFRAKIRRGEATVAPRDYLNRNDAYPFFESWGTLLKTGPTGTNVCDLRVVLVSRIDV